MQQMGKMHVCNVLSPKSFKELFIIIYYTVFIFIISGVRINVSRFAIRDAL